MIILLTLMPKLPIPQLSKQLMVKNSHVDLSFHSKHKLKHSLMLIDTIPENLELIQMTVGKDAGTSSAVPSLQLEPLPEKVLCLLHHLSSYQLIRSS